jgi:hypothetical protein
MRSARSGFMRKAVRFAPALVIGLLPAWSATLEQLTLGDLITKSTAIVRGQISGFSTAYTGSVIYTHFKFNVAQQWKGAPQTTFDVMVPGGVLNGIRQTYPGAPQLAAGPQYILFLWTSSAGLTYTLGFTQGVFNLVQNASGQTNVVQANTTETVLDPITGRPVNFQPISTSLSQLVSQITNGLRGAQ